MMTSSKRIATRIGASLGLGALVAIGGCSDGDSSERDEATAQTPSALTTNLTVPVTGSVLPPSSCTGPNVPLSCLQYSGNPNVAQMEDPYAYDLAAGGSVDIDLGRRAGGTTLQIDNCAKPSTGDPTLTMKRAGVAVTLPSTSGCGSVTGVFATVSTRMSNQSFVAHIACSAACSGSLHVTATLRFQRRPHQRTSAGSCRSRLRGSIAARPERQGPVADRLFQRIRRLRLPRSPPEHHSNDWQSLRDDVGHRPERPVVPLQDP